MMSVLRTWQHLTFICTAVQELGQEPRVIFEHDDSGEREVLGEGGFAFVYLAYVRSDLAPVAVKSLKREFITDL